MQKNGELIGGKSRIRSRKREKKSGKKKKRIRRSGSEQTVKITGNFSLN